MIGEDGGVAFRLPISRDALMVMSWVWLEATCTYLMCCPSFASYMVLVVACLVFNVRVEMLLRRFRLRALIVTNHVVGRNAAFSTP